MDDETLDAGAESAPEAESGPPTTPTIPRALPVVLEPGSPPWLWFWMGLQLWALPSTIDGLKGYAQEYGDAMQHGLVGAVFVFSAGVDWLSGICVFGGIVFALLPWLRALYIERVYGLTNVAENAGWAQEVEAFLAGRWPRLQIRVNLLRAAQLCFVYPSGYHRATLAVFGGFVRLWRSDRAAAESILLHEIEHHRRGDNLILGAGSFFEGGIRASLLCLVVVVAITLGVTWRAIGAKLGYAYYPLFVLSMIVQIVQPFVVPVACIWIAEFNADRFASTLTGSTSGILGALELLRGPGSPIRSLLMRLTHPPIALRRRLASAKTQARWLTGILLILIGGLAVSSLLVYSKNLLFTRTGINPTPTNSFDLPVGFLLESLPWFFAIAALMLLWPAISPIWVKVFSGEHMDAVYKAPAAPLLAWSAAMIAPIAAAFYCIHLRNLYGAMADANNRREIVGVWQLESNRNTLIQFEDNGEYVLLSELPDGDVAGIGTYRFTDDSHVRMTGSLVLDGNGNVAPKAGDDRTVEVHIGLDSDDSSAGGSSSAQTADASDAETLSIVYFAGGSPLQWQRVEGSGNLLDVFNNGEEEESGDQDQNGGDGSVQYYVPK